MDAGVLIDKAFDLGSTVLVLVAFMRWVLPKFLGVYQTSSDRHMDFVSEVVTLGKQTADQVTATMRELAASAQQQAAAVSRVASMQEANHGALTGTLEDLRMAVAQVDQRARVQADRIESIDERLGRIEGHVEGGITQILEKLGDRHERD